MQITNYRLTHGMAIKFENIRGQKSAPSTSILSFLDSKIIKISELGTDLG